MYRLAPFAAAICVLVAFCAPAAAQTPSSGFSEADRLILRGDSHYYDGNYYRAISAYQDFLWEYPDDHRAERVRLKTAWVYYSAEEYREAAQILDEMAEQQSDQYEGWWARNYLGDVARDAERFPLARRSYEGVIDLCRPILDQADPDTPNPDVDHCIELTTRARLALADVHASIHEFDDAVEQLESVPEQSDVAGEAVEIADVVRDIEIPQKSPALAGVLSIVPGFGHFYLGEVRTGVLAMIWNGIFAYGLADTIMAGNVGQAILIGLLESIWYGGTIFGAISGAHRYNRDARRVVEDGMREDIREVHPDHPWPARFPADAPTYLELELEF